MQINDIIDTLNQLINDLRYELKINVKGKFVLKRNYEIQTIKALKKFSYELWYITPKGNNNKIIEDSIIIKCNKEDVEKEWEKLYNKILYDIMYILYNDKDKLTKIIHGE